MGEGRALGGSVLGLSRGQQSSDMRNFLEGGM